MFNLGSLSLQLLAAASLVVSSPVQLEARGDIAHDAVQPFPETVPAGIVGQLMLKYKPYLKVTNGCVPFPAVDAQGDTSGGLKPTGAPEGHCSSSTGQVYARAGSYNGAFGIMYSWYMPKDEPSSGIGHRYDFENAVLWLTDDTANAKIRGVAVSGHGQYTKSLSPPMSGTHPKVEYRSQWPLDHQLFLTNAQGGQQPLIAWDSMTQAVRDAITNKNWDKAIPPFLDNNFQSYLAKSFI